MRLPGERRLKMGCDAFAAARALQLVGLGDEERQQNMKVRIFLRTYRSDFDPQTLHRIAEWLARRAD